MEIKSRVLKYEKLRKKIAKMEDYSFAESEDNNEKPQTGSHLAAQEEDKLFFSSNGVKKNTLSMTLDDLLSSQEEVEEERTKKETKTLYKKKAKEQKQKEPLSQGKVLLMVFIPILLCITLFVILFVTGVI